MLRLSLITDLAELAKAMTPLHQLWLTLSSKFFPLCDEG